MPRSFLIKKHFGGSGAVKAKKPREDVPRPHTPLQKYDDESRNLVMPQDLTPPRTPSTESVKTPPPEMTLIGNRSSPDTLHIQTPSPIVSEPLNLNATSPWPKTMAPPYLPFNFPSLYPAFPQPPSTADFYGPLYPVSLAQRATLPGDQPTPYTTSPREAPTVKKPEPLAPLPVDGGNANISAYIYRMWCSENKKESCINGSTGTSNSDGVGEASETTYLKKRANREAPRYQCSDCSKSYSTLSGLTKHQQFHCVTQAKKSFACKFCEKVYVSLGALKMHIRTHTLPCKCKLCGKAFSRPWLLQGHVRTHTGEKPFACPHCNRAFADRSNLRAHLQTHSDVKKYSCKNCSKTFSRMSLLLKHEDGGCAGTRDVDASITQVPR